MDIDEIIMTTKRMLKVDEGWRDKPYKDTRGFLTIGYGHCLDKKGISRRVGDLLLDEDQYDALLACVNNISFFKSLDLIRQCVLVDMCFNLGINGLLGFKKMLDALEERDYKKATAEMIDSNWYKQVHKRAERLALMMQTGEMVEEYK